MAEITGMYIALQNRLIDEYGITICDGICPLDNTPCHNSKCSVHRCQYFDNETKEYKYVRNWEQEDTVESTYILLHEIGHTINQYKFVVEDEYEASRFAIRKCKESGINLTRKIVADNQRSIRDMYVEETKRFQNNHLYGTRKPDWVKTAEDYNIVRYYDQVYEFDLKEYVRQLNGCSING